MSRGRCEVRCRGKIRQWLTGDCARGHGECTVSSVCLFCVRGAWKGMGIMRVCLGTVKLHRIPWVHVVKCVRCVRTSPFLRSYTVLGTAICPLSFLTFLSLTLPPHSLPCERKKEKQDPEGGTGTAGWPGRSQMRDQGQSMFVARLVCDLTQRWRKANGLKPAWSALARGASPTLLALTRLQQVALAPVLYSTCALKAVTCSCF